MKKFLFYTALVATIVAGCVEKIVPLSGSLHGVVKDAATLATIEGCTVTLSPTGASVTTGNDGIFSFANLDPNEYRLNISNSNYFPSSETVTIIVGREQSKDILMDKIIPGTICGVVKDRDSSKVLSGCVLTIKSTGATARSGADGSYSFAGITPGPYSIDINMAGYYQDTKNFVLPNGSTLKADILLEKINATTGSVGGEIRDKDKNTLLNGVLVSLEPGGRTSTTSNGAYSFNSIAPGKYTLAASFAGYDKAIKEISITAGNKTTSDFLMSTTAPKTELPKLAVAKLIEVTTNSIEIEGEVTSAGSTAVTERGFVYSQTSNPIVGSASKKVVQGAVGIFSATITGLKENTSYYLAPYAINSYGTAYGEQLVSKTKQTPASNIIYVAIAGSDANDGSSWAKAKRTITDAISIASSGKQIWVAIGTYNETFRPKSGVNIYGGFTGTETSTSARTQKTSAKGLSCDAFASATVIDGFSFSDRITLRDFASLENCNVNNINTAGGYGAVINIAGQANSATIRNCTVNNNTSTDYDGIINLNSGSLILVNTFIQCNQGAALILNGKTEMYNCVVTNNSDGIAVNNSNVAEIYNCTIASNSNFGVKGSGAILNNCLIWNNPTSGNISTNYCKTITDANNDAVKLKKPSAGKGPTAPDRQGAEWMLIAGSSCINAGVNLLYPVNKYPVDIAGKTRINGSAIDIGAYEY
jgi:hypothetical protein